MNESQDPQFKSGAGNDDELLTAYLDGELEEDSRLRVESRLSSESALRANLRRLQQTWDVLDQLPQTEPRASFTQTTLELVVADARAESQRQRPRSWEPQLKLALLIAVPLLAWWGGWQAIRYRQDASNRELIEQLPVIDNVDVYLKAENLEFVTLLKDAGLFDENDEYTDELLEQ